MTVEGRSLERVTAVTRQVDVVTCKTVNVDIQWAVTESDGIVQQPALSNTLSRLPWEIIHRHHRGCLSNNIQWWHMKEHCIHRPPP